MASQAEADFRLHLLATELGWPLADYECKHGAMPHDQPLRCSCFETRERTYMTMLEDLSATVPCREEGCTEIAPRRGRYAGRCPAHRDAGVEPEPEDEVEHLELREPEGELIGAAHDVEHARRVLDEAKERFELAQIGLEGMKSRLRDLLDAA